MNFDLHFKLQSFSFDRLNCKNCVSHVITRLYGLEFFDSQVMCRWLDINLLRGVGNLSSDGT